MCSSLRASPSQILTSLSSLTATKHTRDLGLLLGHIRRPNAIAELANESGKVVNFRSAAERGEHLATFAQLGPAYELDEALATMGHALEHT